MLKFRGHKTSNGRGIDLQIAEQLAAKTVLARNPEQARQERQGNRDVNGLSPDVTPHGVHDLAGGEGRAVAGQKGLSGRFGAPDACLDLLAKHAD